MFSAINKTIESHLPESPKSLDEISQISYIGRELYRIIGNEDIRLIDLTGKPGDDALRTAIAIKIEQLSKSQTQEDNQKAEQLSTVLEFIIQNNIQSVRLNQIISLKDPIKAKPALQALTEANIEGAIRVNDALIRSIGVRFLGDFEILSKDDLTAVRGLGPVGIADIMQMLQTFNIKLGSELAETGLNEIPVQVRLILYNDFNVRTFEDLKSLTQQEITKYPGPSTYSAFLDILVQAGNKNVLPIIGLRNQARVGRENKLGNGVSLDDNTAKTVLSKGNKPTVENKGFGERFRKLFGGEG